MVAAVIIIIALYQIKIFLLKVVAIIIILIQLVIKARVVLKFSKSQV